MIKCLNDFEKAYILRMYRIKKMNQKELAAAYSVSPRTINRLLIEAGALTPSERTKAEEYLITKLVKGYGLDLDSLSTLLKGLYDKSA